MMYVMRFRTNRSVEEEREPGLNVVVKIQVGCGLGQVVMGTENNSDKAYSHEEYKEDTRVE